MTGIRLPLAALRVRLGSTPSVVRVARSRSVRVRMLAVLGSVAVMAAGLSVAAAPPASAATWFDGTTMWAYTASGGAATIDFCAGGPGCTGAVTIPSSVGSPGITVTSIGTGAFDTGSPDFNVTSLVVPDSVTSIGSQAFYNNRGLTSVTLGSGLTSIGSIAFGFTGLTSLVIPSNVTSIGYQAFRNTSSLVAVTLGSGLTSIGRYAFRNAGFSSIVIPSSVTSIEEGAFYQNVSLASITFRGTRPTIGADVFLGDSAATKILIPTGLGWPAPPAPFADLPTEYEFSPAPTPATPAAPAAPAAPPLPAPQTLPPVPGVAPVAGIPAGGSAGSVNGVPVTTTVTVNPAGGVQVAGGGSTVALADIGPDGNPLPATGGALAGTPGGGLSVSASGFLPQSQADVYMYSEQLWLGKATVDAGGNVSMSLTIPSWVTPGAHTLQFVGYQGPYTSIALSTGITVAAPAAAAAAVPPVSGVATGFFRPGAIALTSAAKARLWNAVNAPAPGKSEMAVACSATHVKPATASERALWAQRDAGIAGFLTRAGCDTVTARLGDLAGIAGAARMAVRITATVA